MRHQCNRQTSGTWSVRCSTKCRNRVLRSYVVIRYSRYSRRIAPISCTTRDCFWKLELSEFSVPLLIRFEPRPQTVLEDDKTETTRAYWFTAAPSGYEIVNKYSLYTLKSSKHKDTSQYANRCGISLSILFLRLYYNDVRLGVSTLAIVVPTLSFALL